MRNFVLRLLELVGTTDFVISAHHNEEAIMEGAIVLFELFKPGSTQKKLKQAQLELLAADRKSNYCVITVLTDLNDKWIILWLRKNTSKSIKDKFAFICHKSVGREYALGFLRYHLKVVEKMLAEKLFVIDIRFDDEDDDGSSDDRGDDDGLDRPKKRQRLLSICTPTFEATSIVSVRALISSDKNYDHLEMCAGISDDQLSFSLMRNFYERHNYEINAI